MSNELDKLEWHLPERRALTQADLAEARCMTPGCQCGGTVTYFVQQCHPDAGLCARYDKSTGEVTLECAACDATVADFLLAEKPPAERRH